MKLKYCNRRNKISLKFLVTSFNDMSSRIFNRISWYAWFWCNESH